MDGSCHCGAVRWRFEGAPESATSCNCSICRRHGALWAYGFDGEAFTVWAKRRPMSGMTGRWRFTSAPGAPAWSPGSRRLAARMDTFAAR